MKTLTQIRYEHVQLLLGLQNLQDPKKPPYAGCLVSGRAEYDMVAKKRFPQWWSQHHPGWRVLSSQRIRCKRFLKMLREVHVFSRFQHDGNSNTSTHNTGVHSAYDHKGMPHLLLRGGTGCPVVGMCQVQAIINTETNEDGGPNRFCHTKPAKRIKKTCSEQRKKLHKRALYYNLRLEGKNLAEIVNSYKSNCSFVHSSLANMARTHSP